MIYCDHNASAPVRPEVLEAMLPFLGAGSGNASSVHARGSRARCAVEAAREQVAALLGALPGEIVFTSGGTESNNLAIQGAAVGRTVITTAIEHASVREPLAHLGAGGTSVKHLPLDPLGRVVASALSSAQCGSPAFISVGWANNEIGTIQPIDAIAVHGGSIGAIVHVDAVQAAGKLPIHVRGVDLLSLSAHKLGGPQGVGALYVRHGVVVQPLLRGGGQERGHRAGTENVAGIVGFGAACRMAAVELTAFSETSAALRDRLWAGLAGVPGVRRNSPEGVSCLPNTLNVSFDSIRGEALVAGLDLQGIAVSSGSACAAGAGEPSHVLRALGLDEDAARDGIRFSLGRGNTVQDVDRIVAATIAVVQRMRRVRNETPAAAAWGA